jgi:GNAT superfamily N-acetyltransferase
MAYQRRIVGARAQPDGRTFLRVSEGADAAPGFEVEVLDFDVYRRTDTGRQVRDLIEPERVDVSLVDELEGMGFKGVGICLGRLVRGDDVLMRGVVAETPAYFPGGPDGYGEAWGLGKTVGDMGYCRVNFADGGKASVSPILVPEVYRGFGLAGRLLSEAEAVAASKGAATLEAATSADNFEANRIFEHRGYSREELRDRPGQIWWMKKLDF